MKQLFRCKIILLKSFKILTRFFFKVWSSSTIPQNQPQSRLQPYQEATSTSSPVQYLRYQSQDSPVNRVVSNINMEEISNSPQPTSSNISQMQEVQQNSTHNSSQGNQQSSPHIHIQHQQIIGPNGQIINVQSPIHSTQLHSNQLAASVNPNSQVIGSQVVSSHVVGSSGNIVIQGQQPQQRIFISGQPTEPSGPGRPNIQVVPVSISTSRQDGNQRTQQQYAQQQYQGVVQQFDTTKVRGPFIQNGNQVINGYRPGCPQNSHQHNQFVQNPVMINPQQKIWQRMPNVVQQNQIPQQPVPNSNVYERVPPLHQHSPSTSAVWTDEVTRKKVKIKTIKKRPYSLIDGQHRVVESHGPCPNIDVRQIQGEHGRPVIVNQFQQNQNQPSSPSFLEDPSGYLAQQTALLNSTISRQTG